MKVENRINLEARNPRVLKKLFAELSGFVASKFLSYV
jgi:hypothetical protein